MANISILATTLNETFKVNNRVFAPFEFGSWELVENLRHPGFFLCKIINGEIVSIEPLNDGDYAFGRTLWEFSSHRTFEELM